MTAISLSTNPLLRFALLGDAAASGAAGLLLAAVAGPLAPWLGLPAPLLRGAGLVMLLGAVFVAWAGTRAAVARGIIWTVIVAGLLWAADSALLLAAGPVSPTALGTLVVLAQGLAALGFALAQRAGLGRATNSANAVPTYA